MLQAFDVVTNLAVAADEAKRDGRYVCPGCQALVGLRHGARRVPHFAHYSRTLCQLAEPESPRHRALKYMCKRFFAPQTVEWEVAVGERRVDALVDAKFVIECQASALSVLEWQARTANHNCHGYPVLWLWDVKRLCRKNTLAEARVLAASGRPVWVAPELRLCHDESRDVLWVADKHEMLPCRLVPLTARELAAAKRHRLTAAIFWPQALRKIVLYSALDKNARFHFASRTKSLRLVRFAMAL